MEHLFKAAVFAAALAGASTASAAVVVYTPTAVVPEESALVTAVDISVGQFITATEVLTPGMSAEFTFTALEDLIVNTIALSGTDNNSGLDLSNVEFGLSSATTDSFETVVSFGPSGAAFDSIAGFLLETGDMFTIFWEDGLVAPVGITASFSTTAPNTGPTPIPVPAALPLLAGAIALLGVVRRKA